MTAGVPAGRPLTVLLDAGPWLPVPPRGYGGIEAVLATLVPPLRELGVRVVLATVGTSEVEVDETVTTFAAPRFAAIAAPYNQVMGIAAAHVDRVLEEVRGRDDLDLVHSHLEAWGLVAYADAGVPVLHTLHWDLGKHPELYGRFDGHDRVFVNGVSAAQLAGAPAALRRHALGHVHLATPLADEPAPGVDPAEHDPAGHHPAGHLPGGHLVVLARLTPAKGQDVAARLAPRTGRRVVLAGPVGPHHSPAALDAAVATDPRAREHPDVAWFLDEVAPLLDGDRVRWVGALHGADRDRLVATAAAQLCPLRWDEPGGTGIVESLALGTPVVGYGRGCLPELLDQGRTGLLVTPDDEDALAGLLAAGDDRTLDRDACRAAARRRFTPQVMARGYLRLYREVLAHATTSARGPLAVVRDA